MSFDARLCAVAVSCVGFGGLSPLAFGQASLTLLDLPAGASSAYASFVSDDGRIVVGDAIIGGQSTPVIWTDGVPLAILPPPPATRLTQPNGMSADGSVFVGTAQGPFPEANFAWYRWDSGVLALIDPPTGELAASANGLDSSGSVVVGGGTGGPWVWEPSVGYTVLTTSCGSGKSARGISGDGNLVVGTGGSGCFDGVWRRNGGLWTFDDLNDFPMRLERTNEDGSVLIGQRRVQGCSTQGATPTRWHLSNEVECGSPLVPVSCDIGGTALASRADGLVVIGQYTEDFQFHGFVWTPKFGAVDLADVLEGAGVPTQGLGRMSPRGMSRDGRYVVGSVVSATEARPFVASLPASWLCPWDLTTSAVPGTPGYGLPDGTLNNEDFFYFLTQFAAGNNAVCDLTRSANPGDPCFSVPDGVRNNEDFFYYLLGFSVGC